MLACTTGPFSEIVQAGWSADASRLLVTPVPSPAATPKEAIEVGKVIDVEAAAATTTKTHITITVL